MNKVVQLRLEGARIKRKRVFDGVQKLGLDYQELADRLQALTGHPVVTTSIILWATGRRNIPLSYLEAFSKLLGVSEADLLGRTDDPKML